MQPNLLVRTATPHDAQTIAGFNAAMADESEGRRLDHGTLLAGVRQVFSDPAKGVYYVAQQGETVVGQMLVTREWSDWRDGWFWWIQSVYVRPEARRHGVYRALHTHVEQLARRDPTARGLRLYVDADNTRAQEVYRRLGMAATHYQLFETDWSGVEAR